MDRSNDTSRVTLENCVNIASYCMRKLLRNTETYSSNKYILSTVFTCPGVITLRQTIYVLENGGHG